MSVIIELQRFDWDGVNLTLPSGETLNAMHVWYGIDDRMMHVRASQGDPWPDVPVATIERISAKEFTIHAADGGDWTIYRIGCGCGG